MNYDIEWFESFELGERYCRIKIAGRPVTYVFPKDMTNTYALVALKYGSCDTVIRLGEEDSLTIPDGTAHFLEHKMFTNEDGSDSFERFAALGAEANAYTSHDRTVYLFNCTDNFRDAYRELLHMVTHPYFTDQTVKKEQGIISQEIAMYDDDPDDVCYLNLLEVMYSTHPVKNKVCGSVESILSITPELLYSCHRAFYGAANMVSIVCGRVDPAEVAGIVAREIAAQEPMARPAVYTPSEPKGVHRELSYAERQVSKPIFCIGIKGADISPQPAGRRALHLTLRILCRMIFASSGDLYNAIYDDGLMPSPFLYNHDYSENYSHVIVSGSSERPEEVYSRVREYIEKLCKEGIDPADFERCRRVLLADIIARYDSTEDIANSLIGCAFWDLDIFEDGRVVSHLTVTEAERLLRKYFVGEAFALSVVSPISSDKNTEMKGKE